MIDRYLSSQQYIKQCSVRKMSTTAETTFILSHSLFSTRLMKKIDHAMSVHGISFTEYIILHCLNASPNKTMRRIELAECVGITASGITRLLAPMEKIKLVEKEKNPRDARVSLVKLSTNGERLYSDTSTSFEHIAQDILEPLTSTQLETLTHLIGKL